MALPVRSNRNAERALKIGYVGLIGEHAPVISFLDTLADSIAYHQKPTPVLRLALIRRKTARYIGKDCYPSAKGFRPTDHLPQQQALEQMADSDTLLCFC